MLPGQGKGRLRIVIERPIGPSGRVVAITAILAEPAIMEIVF